MHDVSPMTLKNTIVTGFMVTDPNRTLEVTR